MKEARVYVDFNEMLEDDLVLLSKTDFKEDSEGNEIKFHVGMKVKIYMDDLDEFNKEDNLIADGIVELNKHPDDWTRPAKWNCRIDSKGIYRESQL